MTKHKKQTKGKIVEKEEKLSVGGEIVVIGAKNTISTISKDEISTQKLIELLKETGKKKLWPEINE